MTLVFVPPWATVGAMVVWVQAWNWRAMPGGRSARASTRRSGSSSGAVTSSGSAMPAEERRQVSWMWVSGLVVGQPLHDPRRGDQGVVGVVGQRGVPGVPVTRSVHQHDPFSPTSTGSRRSPSPPATGMPPDSVMT